MQGSVSKTAGSLDTGLPRRAERTANVAATVCWGAHFARERRKAPSRFGAHFFRVEVVLVELHGILELVVEVILDFAFGVVVGEDQNRQMALGVEIPQSAAAARQGRISAGDDDLLGGLAG